MKKMGKIELYRFIFCICVLLIHTRRHILGTMSLDGFRFALCPHGAIAVEFFFLLSGFLLAKSVYKRQQNGLLPQKLMTRESVTDSISYLLKKYLRIFPYHIVAFLIAFVCYVFAKKLGVFDTVIYALDNIPGFFMVQMSGISMANVNAVEWYISSMLLSMAIIYPVCKRYYYGFTRYIAPLVSIFIIGYIFHETHSLSGADAWLTHFYKAFLRGVVEVSLGTTVFEISRFLSSKKDSVKGIRTVVTLAEAVSFLGVIAFIVLTVPTKYEILALGGFIILLACASSGLSYGEKLFDNKLCYFLGKFSLSLYLAHFGLTYPIKEYLSPVNKPLAVAVMVSGSFAAAFVVMILGDILGKHVFSKIKIPS